MLLAVLTVEFSLHGNDSLKGKRRIANSLKQKVRNQFNVALAEAGTEESLTRLRLMAVSISNSEQHLRSRMDKCALMMEASCPEELVLSSLEFASADFSFMPDASDPPNATAENDFSENMDMEQIMANLTAPCAK